VIAGSIVAPDFEITLIEKSFSLFFTEQVNNIFKTSPAHAVQGITNLRSILDFPAISL